MKIGILTYHRSVNEGAVLQAYCVFKIFKSLFPDAKIEIIDYRPLKMEVNEWKKLIHLKKLRFNKSGIKKFLNVRSFLKRNGVTISRGSITTDKLNKAQNFIKDQKYDLIISGSDTVWEIRDKNKSNVPVAPNIYFLPGLKGVKKIAFAASADPVNIDEEFLFQNGRDKKIRSAINDFDLVFVRDEATRHLVEEIVGCNIKIDKICDPTLLTDFSELIGDQDLGLRQEKQNIVIAVGSRKLHKKISQLFTDKEDIKIINLLGQGNPSELDFVKKPLDEKLNLYRHIDLLITDRFHSSIFALKLGSVPVIFIENAMKWKEENSKGRDLFKRLGFEEFVVRTDVLGDINLNDVKEKILKWEADKEKISAKLKSIINDDMDNIKSIERIFR